MALYIPASRRRRRIAVVAVVAVVAGLMIGAFAGRASAPNVGDRIASVRADARRTSSSLRVIVLHDENGLTTGTTGDSGTELVLQRTRTELDAEFRRAPWLSTAQHDALVRDLDALVAQTDRKSAAFARGAEALAAKIDETFGVG